MGNLTKRYSDYASYLKRIFTFKVQKISINAGFSCPNRDGSIGWGGCTFCNNQTFNPAYCQPDKSITQQIDEGIQFFRNKYPDQRYIAYFQAYTNTYGKLDELKRKYEEALNHPSVVGIVIGTRPDCVDTPLLDYLSEINQTKYVMMEYGIESTLDRTLRLINRGHTFDALRKTIEATANKGIATGGHIILGLPQESNEEMLQHADRIAKLPINCIKLHQLQIIKGTVMARQYADYPEWFHNFSAEEYINLAIRFIERLPERITVERFVSQSPKEMLATPGWGLKNFEITAKLDKRMAELDAWQGKYYSV